MGFPTLGKQHLYTESGPRRTVPFVMYFTNFICSHGGGLAKVTSFDMNLAVVNYAKAVITDGSMQIWTGKFVESCGEAVVHFTHNCSIVLQDYWKFYSSLIARFMGSTWVSSGTDRTQVCPMLAPWTCYLGCFNREIPATSAHVTCANICVKLNVSERNSIKSNFPLSKIRGENHLVK